MVKFGLSVVGICTLLSTFLFAETSKFSPDLAVANGSTKVKVIVHYAQSPSQLNLLNLSQLGGLLIKAYSNINVIAVTIPPSSLQAIANSPGVDYIAPDRPLISLLDYSSAAVNAAVAYNSGLTGLGVGVAVIDSGIAASPDLSLGRVVYQENFVNAGTLLSAASNDGFGHGTHVAGIIAGNGASSQCVNCTHLGRGLAPGATLLDLRVLDANGQGSDSAVLAAIDRAIQLKESLQRTDHQSFARPPYL